MRYLANILFIYALAIMLYVGALAPFAHGVPATPAGNGYILICTADGYAWLNPDEDEMPSTQPHCPACVLHHASHFTPPHPIAQAIPYQDATAIQFTDQPVIHMAASHAASFLSRAPPFA